MTDSIEAADASAATSTSGAQRLLTMMQGVILHHALSAAATLGVADVLKDTAQRAAELAGALNVNEDALYRVLRFLAAQGVFVETGPRTFANNDVSHYLRSDVAGSLSAMVRYRDSPYFRAAFGDLCYSIETSKPAREKVLGMSGFDYLRQHPEEARLFDDAMTAASSQIAPVIAAAYDFGQWGSLADVGGGNGILLAAILRAHPALRGTLMDLEHVLERAREHGFLGQELADRASFVGCDFFQEVPGGCRAYVMKRVIHDWADELAMDILRHCRRAVPGDGALLLVEYAIGAPNVPSAGKAADLVMLVGTGGKERSVEEYGALLAQSGFRLSRIVSTADVLIIEARPV